MSKYNHASNELQLLQKIANLTALILTLYNEGKITNEVKNSLLEVLTYE